MLNRKSSSSLHKSCGGGSFWLRLPLFLLGRRLFFFPLSQEVRLFLSAGRDFPISVGGGWWSDFLHSTEFSSLEDFLFRRGEHVDLTSSFPLEAGPFSRRLPLSAERRFALGQVP